MRIPSIWICTLSLCAAWCLTGCEADGDSSGDSAAVPGITVPVTSGGTNDPAAQAEQPAPGTPATTDGPISLASVVWLHTDVSGWAQTATLSVNVSGSTITLNYDKANTWPAVNTAGATVNANPWVFVSVDGTWYAGTWEWLRAGQTSKSASSVAGDHIQRSPLDAFSPVSGVTYGFMVSGLARSNVRNVEERSNVVMVTWP